MAPPRRCGAAALWARVGMLRCSIVLRTVIRSRVLSKRSWRYFLRRPDRWLGSVRSSCIFGCTSLSCAHARQPRGGRPR